MAVLSGFVRCASDTCGLAGVGVSRRRWVAGLVVTATAVMAVLASALPATADVAGDRGGPLVVRTTGGAIRGVASHGVENFLGVRYARPPVGALRWRAPKPVQPWQGVVPAVAYGNRCPQLASGNGPQSLTEDCLFLNVQRPAATPRNAKLPVYMWFHGGSLLNGSSDQHDGTKIVKQTGIMVVTVNYRLGVLGFLANPALTAAQGESGNYGFLDQQAALRWVHANIAAFGGDPARVTIGGESAGAWSVCAHLVAPGSQGLFARAIIESGFCSSASQADADASGAQLAETVGCPTGGAVLACLRKSDVLSLLNAGDSWSLGANLISGTPTLPRDPGQAVAEGTFAHVPVLIGANRDEARTLMWEWAGGMTQVDYEQFLADVFGTWAPSILAHYPWPATSSTWTAAYLIAAVITDGGFFIGGCSNQALTNTMAGFTRVYAYQFDHRDGPGLRPVPGYVWGAGHAAELPYMWPSFDNGTPIAATFDASERRLSRDMIAYWGAFVRTGRPDSAGGAWWPRLKPDQGDQARLMSLRAGGRSTSITNANLSRQHQCTFWNALLGSSARAVQIPQLG